MNRESEQGDPRRQLPSVSDLLESDALQALAERYAMPVVKDTARSVLETWRDRLTHDEAVASREAIIADITNLLVADDLDRIRPVVNATGIILHTGLGRAVLPANAAEALAKADRPCNLQMDLETGERGKRNHVTEQLLCRLTGAEAALVVNNNATATLLILTALCAGKEVVVSRGQLIEIGGSYRLPDCVHQSGAKMAEVGTTNKTHLRDYEQVLSEETGAILRVNPSNYRVVGFSKQVPVRDLVALRDRSDPSLIVIDDLGCGALVDMQAYGLPHEPTAPESITAGADLVCFSGDKLIGGPQAGIIVGRKDLILRIRSHPLTRMLRVGKLTDLALEQTLRLFLEPETLVEKNPTLRMLAISPRILRDRARRLKKKIDGLDAGYGTELLKAESAVGGGSYPTAPLETTVVAVECDQYASNELSDLLRRSEPPIITRVKDDRVLLDVRTLMPGDSRWVFEALKQIAERKHRR